MNVLELYENRHWLALLLGTLGSLAIILGLRKNLVLAIRQPGKSLDYYRDLLIRIVIVFVAVTFAVRTNLIVWEKVGDLSASFAVLIASIYSVFSTLNSLKEFLAK